MNIFIICLAVVVSNALVGFAVWLLTDMRATDRTNREWTENSEWKRITRIGGAAAWMKNLEER